MRILDRLVAREFLRIFLLFVLGAPFLFVLGDITEKVDRYVDRGLGMGEILLGYAYQLPQFILWSLPIAALVATVFTVHRMTTHHEMVAAKAGGISFHRVVLPLWILGVALTGVGLALSEVVPETNRLRAEVMGERSSERRYRGNFVFQAGEDRVLTVRHLSVPESRISGVVMEREGGQSRPTVHVMANVAVWDSVGGWTFRDGHVRIFSEPGEESTFRFSRMRTPGLRESPSDLLARPEEPEEMDYAELGRLAGVIRRSGGDPSPLLVERAQKIAIPVATLVIVIFGAPLATSSRRGGTAFGVGVSLAATVVYLMFFKVSGAFGEGGVIPPLVAAWLPNVVFLIAGLVLLKRVRT